MWRHRGGFTLIELLIVVVIIGILAATAVPKVAGAKGTALVGSMKADLRNLTIAEEIYSSENGGVFYGGAVPSAALIYNPSSGVTVTLTGVTTTGWAATASHAATARTCAIFVGTATPPSPATVDGQVACTP